MKKLLYLLIFLSFSFVHGADLFCSTGCTLKSDDCRGYILKFEGEKLTQIRDYTTKEEWPVLPATFYKPIAQSLVSNWPLGTWVGQRIFDKQVLSISLIGPYIAKSGGMGHGGMPMPPTEPGPFKFGATVSVIASPGPTGSSKISQDYGCYIIPRGGPSERR